MGIPKTTIKQQNICHIQNREHDTNRNTFRRFLHFLITLNRERSMKNREKPMFVLISFQGMILTVKEN